MHYGLDFGTTNSIIAIKAKNSPKVEVIPVDPFSKDGRVMRSLLYIRKNIQKFTGGKAVKEYLNDSRNRKLAYFRVFDTGRKVTIPIPAYGGGFHYYEADLTYREDINKPGQLLQALKTSLREGFCQSINLFGKEFTLEELITSILLEMKMNADKYTGEKVTSVTLGRPVHYSYSGEDLKTQNRMAQAAKSAGFETINFLPEPVAAAYNYLGSQITQKDQTLFVFDFGGGTLDFCLMKQVRGKTRIIATDGLAVGGDLFNELIMLKKVSPYFGTDALYGPKNLPMPAGLKHSLRKWYELQVLKSPELRSFLARVQHQTENPKFIANLITLIDYDLGFELFEAIEKAKITLSHKNETVISFHQQGIDLEIPLTRREFEIMITPQIDEIEKTIKNLLQEANIPSPKVDVVVCTGGTSYTPLMQKRLQGIFPLSEIVYHNVFQGIAAGLARAGTEPLRG